jgi:hypothetical protein
MPSCNTPDEGKFVDLAAGEIVGGTNTRFSLGSRPLVFFAGVDGDDDAGGATLLSQLGDTLVMRWAHRMLRKSLCKIYLLRPQNIGMRGSGVTGGCPWRRLAK